jgi:hypothetical protein
MVAMPSRAQADSITFVFNCHFANTSPATCVPGGPFGTLTLTDSVVDPKRVDVDLVLTPLFGDALEKVYMNWAPPYLPNHRFYLVPQDAAPGVDSNKPFPKQLGTVQYGDSSLPLGKFAFDIINSLPSTTPFVFHGSLALYNQIPAVDVPKNIDVSDFLATSEGLGTPPLFAAYRTYNCVTNCTGDSDEFWGGSTHVAEPAGLLFMGAGLVGLGALVARQRWLRGDRHPQR